MNERDLFAAANAIADPAERVALLDRECAHRPELRRRIEQLINIPLPPFIAAAPSTGGLSIKRSQPTTPTESKQPRAPSSVPVEDFGLAQRPGMGARIRDFLFVHVELVAAATLAVVVLACGTAWVVSGMYEADRRRVFAESKAESERLTADLLRERQSREHDQAAALARAEDERRQANLLRRQSFAALEDAAASLSKLIANRRNVPTAMRESVESLARRCETFAASLPSDHEGQLLQVDARLRAGKLWELIGHSNEAAAEYDSVCRLLSERSESVTPTERRRLAAAYASLSSILAKQGKTGEALAVAKNAVEERRRLVEESPADLGALAQSLSSLGDRLAAVNRPAEALEAFHEALEAQSKLVAQFPDRPDLAEHLARLHGGFAIVLHRFGRTEEAIASCRASCDLRRKTSERNPTLEYREALANARTNLAILLDESNHQEAALMEYRSALEIRESLAQAKQPDARRRLADTRAQLADLLFRAGKAEESLRVYKAALETIRDLAAQDPGDAVAQERLGLASMNVGEILREVGRPQEAVAYYRLAREVRIGLCRRFAEDVTYARKLADVHLQLFDLFRKLGDADAARDEQQSARAILERLVTQFPSDDGVRTTFINALASNAEFLIDQGKPAESVVEFTRAIDVLDSSVPRSQGKTLAVEQWKTCLWGRARAYAALQSGLRALRDADRLIQQSPPSERQSLLASRPGLRLTAGDVLGAVNDAEQLTRDDAWTAAQWYEFACVSATASSKIPTRRDELARRAMNHLAKATHSGFKDAAHARGDPDLEPLRSRADFQKWLEDLDSAARKPPIR